MSKVSSLYSRINSAPSFLSKPILKPIGLQKKDTSDNKILGWRSNAVNIFKPIAKPKGFMLTDRSPPAINTAQGKEGLLNDIKKETETTAINQAKVQNKTLGEARLGTGSTFGPIGAIVDVSGLLKAKRNPFNFPGAIGGPPRPFIGGAIMGTPKDRAKIKPLSKEQYEALRIKYHKNR
jgi:hypothetical protein